jgi:hypothetical protein
MTFTLIICFSSKTTLFDIFWPFFAPLETPFMPPVAVVLISTIPVAIPPSLESTDSPLSIEARFMVDFELRGGELLLLSWISLDRVPGD